jgi:hypothetical protein
MQFENGPQTGDLGLLSTENDNITSERQKKESKQESLLRDTDWVVHDTDDAVGVSKKLLSKIGLSVEEIPFKARQVTGESSFIPGLIILRLENADADDDERDPISLERAHEVLQYLRDNGVPTANLGQMFEDGVSWSRSELS